jgi:DNA helicase-2/ATP-dependent DNA helicase PcrA
MTPELLRQNIYKKLNIAVKDDNIERLTPEQMEFITHDMNVPCYLEACPGSGKTEVVGIKAAYELIAWEQHFSGMAIVSFTNNASNEIEKRAKKYAGPNATSHPHFIGTLDSFLYKYVLCPFFHGHVNFKGKNGDCSPRMIVDERSDAAFLLNEKYSPKTWYAIPNPSRGPGAKPYIGIPISANNYYFDPIKNDFIILLPGSDTSSSCTLKDFLSRPAQIEYLKEKRDSFLTDEIIYKDFWDAKEAFWRDGFLTFRDSEFLIFQIIEKKPKIKISLIKRFPNIIIDECQDLSPMQLVILYCLVKDGLKIHFIGDLNQSIYWFRDVDPQIIRNFIVANNLKVLYLSNNFRSNQKIVDVFCKVFPNTIVGNEMQYINDCLKLIEYDETEISKLIIRYQEIIKDANVEARTKSVDELIKLSKSSIIIRGSTLLTKFRPYKIQSKNPLTVLTIALKLWNTVEKNTEIIDNAISLLGLFLSRVFYKNEGNSRNQYCPDTISNAKWRISLATLLTHLAALPIKMKEKQSNNGYFQPKTLDFLLVNFTSA